MDSTAFKICFISHFSGTKCYIIHFTIESSIPWLPLCSTFLLLIILIEWARKPLWIWEFHKFTTFSSPHNFVSTRRPPNVPLCFCLPVNETDLPFAELVEINLPPSELSLCSLSFPSINRSLMIIVPDIILDLFLSPGWIQPPSSLSRKLNLSGKFSWVYFRNSEYCQTLT